MLEHVLAKSKPRESLVKHTENALNIWEELKQRYEEYLEVNPSFWTNSFISVFFHDIGKIADNFQDKICGRAKNFDNYIRHEFLSGMLLFYTDPNTFKKDPLNLFAIFSHHKPLHDLLFQENAHKSLKINSEDFPVLINYILETCRLNNIIIRIPDKLVDFFIESATLNKLYHDFDKFCKGVTYQLTAQQRKEYIYYKAILNISDWTASGHEKLAQGLTYNAETLQDRIIFKLKEEDKFTIAESFAFREFQSQSISKEHILAIAPTGSGKTEASLLWASQKKEYEKIIYLLPTRVTSNAIYKRLVTYFGEEQCAVIHSSAFLYRKEIDDTFEKKDYLKDRTFFRNVNVCTVDQMLTQGFNLGYWELKTFHFLNSRIIIDEIHLYQPYTLGLIIASIKYLKNEFGAKFYVMTATMPQKLKSLLQKTLEIQEEQVISDQELLDEARNTFEVREFEVEELYEEITKGIKDHKKILIVVNTVDKAISLYRKYKGIKQHTFCFHSRFIQKDRIDKEKRILDLEKQDESILLIATQVVEVSLDIDFDILYTENAPIDAIIQRAGRINRKREKENTKVIVFQHQKITQEKIYDLPGILDNTFNILQKYNCSRLPERQLLTLVDEVYKGIDIEKDQHFLDGLHKYEEIQTKLHFIKDNLNQSEVYTREGLDSVNVIPDIYYEKLSGIDDVIRKSNHEVSIRAYRAIGAKKDNQGFRYVDYEYDNETGLKFNRKSTPTTINL